MRVSLPPGLLSTLRRRAVVEGIPVEELIDRLLIEELPKALSETARSYLLESEEGDRAARNGQRVISGPDDPCPNFETGVE
jgi:hypothetical protein